MRSTGALHRAQARALTSIMGSIIDGAPLAAYERRECVRLVNALARLISSDPEICRRIEAAAEEVRDGKFAGNLMDTAKE
jgi:hypothetical protein